VLPVDEVGGVLVCFHAQQAVEKTALYAGGTSLYADTVHAVEREKAALGGLDLARLKTNS
jgi:hypothetical protein